MLLPVSAGPALNSTMPISATKLARDARNLSTMRAAAAKAKSAVLGNCQSASSFASQGANVVADVINTQNTQPDAASVASPGSSAGGAGGYSAAAPPPAVEVVSIGSMGLPPAPTYPSLTTGQNSQLPANFLVPSAPANPVPSSSAVAVTSTGIPPVGPPWGSSSTSPAKTIITTTGLAGGNPALSWLLILAGAYFAFKAGKA